MKFTDKACPVLLRRREDRLQILAFRHPKAGSQLVKGTVEEDEEPNQTVLRELGEESGIEDARVVEPLGQLALRGIKQRWHLFLCVVERTLPDEWSHYTTDGGGHDFAFFWQNLDEEPDDDWHPDFRKGLGFIRRRMEEKGDGSLAVSP
ncbi:MAG: NUDIX domain-containing protein [Caldilineaceae bacterium]|nr:NUDIX domain-containing protein [Caldilineaceae bacterium]HRJ44332.1 NUDIX domain-containing protein [Caldilineaceae bacterium]